MRTSRSSDEPPVTERPNPRTAEIDALPARALIELLLDEDAGVAGAVRRALPGLERAQELLYSALRSRGRWFNLGAGTSGRIGYLDAAELPPTFGVADDAVQALIAGGRDALVRAVEGAEDDPHSAASLLTERGFCDRDVLVGLSASGRTPFVLGGVDYARARRAPTIGITCAPGSPLARRVDVAIVAEVGPEAIAGSTRLKGGLAQKMILHTLSTAVMVRLGRVRGNRMVQLQVKNEKLRQRAIGMLMELTGCDRARAAQALATSGDSVARALDELSRSDVPR